MDQTIDSEQKSTTQAYQSIFPISANLWPIQRQIVANLPSYAAACLQDGVIVGGVVGYVEHTFCRFASRCGGRSVVAQLQGLRLLERALQNHSTGILTASPAHRIRSRHRLVGAIGMEKQLGYIVLNST